MTIDLDVLIKVIGFLLSVGSPVFAWMIANAKTAAEIAIARRYTDDKLNSQTTRLDEIDKRVAAKELRISKVEQDLQHIPNKDAVHRIELTIQKLQGDVEQATSQWRSVQASIQRLEEFLVHARTETAPAPARSRRK